MANVTKKTGSEIHDVKKIRFLVTGGSGSLGREIIKRLLFLGAQNIISISRDEELIKKAEIEISSPLVKFKTGDITDSETISRIMKDVDIVFNTAALKHVSLAEKNPGEFHRVNILGLQNLLRSSQSTKRFFHISSDKAIGVMNCYGATKLLGEYLVRENNDFHPENKYAVFRCPNFLGSRGSVLDIWLEQLKKYNKIKVSDLEMTRYFITLPDVANFIVNIGLSKDLDIKQIYYPFKFTKKFNLGDLAKAFLQIYGNKNSKIEITGASAGEKKHEDYIADVPLSSVEELVKILKQWSP